ncbi:MAG: flagellar biosynthesis protein FlgJ [Alphaproteobacteria bacterium]|nr:flagellar biosynthesis protein FlgJ [Alphaproteobacteria bacterium]|tara:strand:+ start:897 stop:1238 length:342 start_codon:yes stop_codon:yes gene_type:complete
MSTGIDSTVQFAQQQLGDATATKRAQNLAAEHGGNFDEAAADFEAMFITQMLKPLFESIEVNPMFGGGKGEEIFQGFLIEEYGKSLGQAGGVGIADHVKQELIRIQEMAQKQQ